MKKKINIILIKDCLNLGEKGEVTNVFSGYALNYLVPNQIAEIATKHKIKHLKMLSEKKNRKEKANQIISNELKQKLQQINKISIHRKIGEKNYIFGRITEKDIINYIIKYTGIKLDKKQIEIDHIKTLGVFETKVQVSNNINSIIKLNILPINI